jgi:adenylate kinase
MNLVIFGAPGSGKGTQSEYLKKEMGFDQISTGDLVRSEIAENSSLGLYFKDQVEQGKLPGDECILKLFEKALQHSGENRIFDGFPRTTAQAQALLKLLSDRDEKVDSVVVLDVPFDNIIERITNRYACQTCGKIYSSLTIPKEGRPPCAQCGGESFSVRKDDRLEAVETRLKTYEEHTKPLLEFFKGKAPVFTINGLQEPEIVFQEIADIIKSVRVNKTFSHVI